MGPWTLPRFPYLGPIYALNLCLSQTLSLDLDGGGLQSTGQGMKWLLMPLNNEAAHGVCVS